MIFREGCFLVFVWVELGKGGRVTCSYWMWVGEVCVSGGKASERKLGKKPLTTPS